MLRSGTGPGQAESSGPEQLWTFLTSAKDPQIPDHPAQGGVDQCRSLMFSRERGQGMGVRDTKPHVVHEAHKVLPGVHHLFDRCGPGRGAKLFQPVAIPLE